MRSPAPRTLLLSFAASWYGYAGMAFGIALLNLLTLGLYKPYGLTRQRRALYRNIYIGRDPLSYEGTASALSRTTFYPSLVLLAVLIVPGIVQFLVSWQMAVMVGVVQLFMIVAYYQYLAFAGYQYNLSQISWRGYTLTLGGTAWHYMKIAFMTYLANLATLGALGLWRRTQLARAMYGDLRFGRHPVAFNLETGPLWLPYLIGWAAYLMGWVLLGLYYWRAALVPLQLLLSSGTPDPAMASAVDPAMFSGEAGPPDQGTLAEMGTYMNALTLALFVVIPAALLWKKICLAWYECCWWEQFCAAFTLGGAGLRFDGSVLGLALRDIISWMLNMFFVNLTRPFTSFARQRYFCAHAVITHPESLENLLQPPTKAG